MVGKQPEDWSLGKLYIKDRGSRWSNSNTREEKGNCITGGKVRKYRIGVT